jgi:NaMN:DMB phosphoribosyltransferase
MDGNSDYIDAGTNTAAAVSGALTVEAWIKPVSVGSK